MPKPPYVLSFATDQERDQLFIHADAAGLDYLIRSLARIRQSIDANICDHDHLMTAAWGGSELTERGLDEGTRTVQHVKIYGWTPEWIQKHGFLAEHDGAPSVGTAAVSTDPKPSGGPPSMN